MKKYFSFLLFTILTLFLFLVPVLFMASGIYLLTTGVYSLLAVFLILMGLIQAFFVFPLVKSSPVFIKVNLINQVLS